MSFRLSDCLPRCLSYLLIFASLTAAHAAGLMPMPSAAWLSGNSMGAFNQRGIYGTLGTTSTLNAPGNRTGACRWTDANGDLWMFGGLGTSSQSSGYLNDMWRMDQTSQTWVWEKGSSISNSSPRFGTQGVSHPDNVPAGRSNAQYWNDAQGNFWVFGGTSRTTTVVELNDLWKFEPPTRLWTWMGGSQGSGSMGSYGTLGTPSPSNQPPSRSSALSWADASGNLWLHGGFKNFASPTGRFADTWKYNIASGQWTWVSGANTLNAAGSYGTKGVATASNYPPPRTRFTHWALTSGTLYLFGGELSGSNKELNDLWRFDPNAGLWTWMKGSNGINDYGYTATAGSFNPLVNPRCRTLGQAAVDNQGNIWLFGGEDSLNDFDKNMLNDVYQFNGTDWAWMKGSAIGSSSNPVYGTKGVEDSSNHPAARIRSTFWYSNNYLYCYGGSTSFKDSYYQYSRERKVGDLWRFNPATRNWAWIAGDKYVVSSLDDLDAAIDERGVYGERFIEDPDSKPGIRNNPLTWTDTLGKFWLFAGTGAGSSTEEAGNLNDFWRFSFDSGMWAWLGGSDSRIEMGTYTAYNTFATTNSPGIRMDACLWTDNQGNAWLYGGRSQSYNWIYSDVWKYDASSKQWACLSGSRDSKSTASYGTLGVPHQDNQPGSRYGAARWTDKQGNFWLYGGRGGAPAGTDHLCADLWKYDPAQGLWTWVKGSKAPYTTGTYGMQTVPDLANFPGSRYNANTWTDEQGDLWMFGGNSYDSSSAYPYIINDLWRYNIATNTWTWMKGSNINNGKPTYGARLVEGPANIPGSRERAQAWSSGDGYLWLFGGNGWGDTTNWPYPVDILPPTPGPLSDVWRYSIATNNWTWMKGPDNSFTTQQITGISGEEAEGNNPSPRQNSAVWSDAGGNGWLFGGSRSGIAINNDYWRYNPRTNNWTWFGVSPAEDQYGSFDLQGVFSSHNNPGSREYMGYASSPDKVHHQMFGGNGYGLGYGICNDLWEVRLPDGATAASPLWLDSNIIY